MPHPPPSPVPLLRAAAHTALLASVLILAACDSTGGPSGSAGTCVSGSMTATADGQAFAAECVTFTLDDGVLGLGGLTNPDGDDGPSQRQITLVAQGASTGAASAPVGFIGTYTDGTLDGAQFSGTSTTSLSGTLTLETLTDSRAAGTFTFSGSEFELSASAGGQGSGTPTGRTVSVTGGTFDIRL